ncbi:hypothetical protein OJF2_41960 [Aquisphaera giovannonii]|uniref:Uncharacterized protein n=1 Tax=Aquisphaera giovannonii TaxID=406548 RepID=A0A5B9W4X2_9BACT|nr:hypothetical protein [Aquisphaera giovannonii]QEH35642.1 hypothetical protein OJF2_41960 [Aquisphaera giovannonii]
MKPTHAPSRRHFLESAAAGTLLLPGIAPAATVGQAGRKPRIAAIATTYFYLSHAYHIVGRFLDGFPVYREGDDVGDALHKPGFDVASLFIDQTPDATDLGRAKARKYGVRLSPTIEDALTLGTGTLAVDAVLLIGEHGNYPDNEKLQRQYPRGAFFRRILDVFRASGRVVPVFNDKHLSYDRAEAIRMVDQAKALGVPFMAGSSLPVTWRYPELEIPLGRPFRDILAAFYGPTEPYGFHGLEILQCMAERRARRGRPQGVKAVTCLEGDAVWKAGDEGLWSWELLRHALGRSRTVNVGDIRQNCRDVGKPVAFLVEYADGLRGTVLLLNGHVQDGTVAVRTEDAKGHETIASTLTYLPPPPGARFFDPLALRIEDFFRTGKPPYPIQRTLLTTGILDAAMDSRVRGHVPVATPELAGIDYEAPEDSGFIRAPLTDPTPNRI